MPEVCNFIKKETLAQLFSCEFYEISKNNFFTEKLLQKTCGYLQKTFPLFAGSSKRCTVDAFPHKFNRQQVIESAYPMFD